MQLDMFTPMADADDILTEKASALLEALNDGRKPRDQYEPHSYTQLNDLIVLVACNKERDFVFNVVDLDGNLPPNFSANWRNAQHVIQDLKEHLPMVEEPKQTTQKVTEFAPVEEGNWTLFEI